MGDYPYHTGKHLLVLVGRHQYVYADESGIHEEAQSCMVGGWMGAPSQWAEFNPRWHDAIAEYQVWNDALDKEAGLAFHAKHFFPKINWRSSHSPYAGWSDGRATEFLDRLLLESRRTPGLYPIGGIVVTEDFRALDTDTRRFMTGGLVTYRAKPGQLVRKEKFDTSGAPDKPYFRWPGHAD